MDKLQHPEREGTLVFSEFTQKQTCALSQMKAHATHTPASAESGASEDKPMPRRPSWSSGFRLSSSHLHSKAFEKRRKSQPSGPSTQWARAVLNRFHLRNPMSVHQQNCGPMLSPKDEGPRQGWL